jgi:hypothetical protein
MAKDMLWQQRRICHPKKQCLGSKNRRGVGFIGKIRKEALGSYAASHEGGKPGALALSPQQTAPTSPETTMAAVRQPLRYQKIWQKK